ncbi:MAG: DNA recombination protein RmuC [Clostridia bacterium]|nr:DNA recombination protein RmuC [Clostridia bacterium]MDD4375405.1 DNA recombination protein RmuC [Clostridia bacterium]
MDLLYMSIIVLLVVTIIILLVTKSRKNDIKEISELLKENRDIMDKSIGNKIVEGVNVQQNQLTNLTNLNENKLENIRKIVDERLHMIQKDNNEKLEKMRITVDEKLQGTLEKRLGESFKLVNDRLESVYKGLGEMQTLAQGVGDLKKVFTNVKSRGYWGELQLSNILEQFLTKEQFLVNVKIKEKSNDFVEFAIKLPGKTNKNDFVLLPVDSKFPIEDYSRLVEAEELGDITIINESKKGLENSIKTCAKAISDKYIDPPFTTDFGIMFLPTESLYSEVVRNTSLCEILAQKYRVVVTGPSTFIALLNSLQMGFRTLAIEKRSSEVWELLGVVKSEFSKFGSLLEKTNKKLQEISSTMSLASRKTRTIERKLRDVESLPVAEDSFYDSDENTDNDSVETDI